MIMETIKWSVHMTMETIKWPVYMTVESIKWCLHDDDGDSEMVCLHDDDDGDCDMVCLQGHIDHKTVCLHDTNCLCD